MDSAPDPQILTTRKSRHLQENASLNAGARGRLHGRRAKTKTTNWIKPISAVLVGGALLAAPFSPIHSVPAEAAGEAINLIQYKAGDAQHISDMTFLATRSQSKTLTKSGTGPYVMSHTNADPSKSYSYPTDVNYGGSSSTGAQMNESDVRAPSSMSFSYLVTGSTTTISGDTTTSRTGAKLKNHGTVVTTPTGGSGTNRTADGTHSYGAIFGPEVWSEPFEATNGQAVSFDWTAQGGGDDYEIYGFLVAIAAGSSCSASTDFGGTTEAEKLASHSILVHARGKTATVTNTASGNIESAGCYRFRFVNGTYDATGGFLVGATFEILNPVLGLGQTISLDQLDDRVVSSSDSTATLSATTNANQTVTFAEHGSSAVCNVSSTGVVTLLANKTGQCTVRADAQAIDVGADSYAAAPTVYMSFSVLASATKPVYSGGASISGSALVCSTLTAVEGQWGTGGAAIDSTTIQWLSNGSVVSGATGSTYVLSAEDVGNSISFSVSKTNSVGTTSATSSGLLAIDARLTSLALSSGSLSPGFDSCTAGYSITTSSDELTVTPTISAGAESIEVNNSEVLSGEPTNPIALTPGANTITLTVASGIFSRDITITANYLSAPTVIALTPDFISGTDATLQASINANGFATSSISFRLIQIAGATQTPNQAALSSASASGTTPTSITQSVTNLLSGGTYEFRATAINQNGTTNSSTITFQTPDAPTVTTSAALNVAASSADLPGTVLGHSYITDVNLVYSQNADLSSATTVALSQISASDAATTQNVSQTLTGLVTGSTYYYRYEASNSQGSNVGDTKSFTTAGAPTITHDSHTIGERSATLVASVNVNGADTTQDIKFTWSTAADFSSPTEVVATPSRLVAGGDRLVSITLSSLTPATQYHFKVTATNSVGTTTSTAESFTTATDPVPTVVLQAPTNVTVSSPITVTVRFSEIVTGLQSGDFTIGGSPSYTAAAPQDLGSGVYQLTLTTASNSTGTVTVDLPANKVTDAGGQGNTAAAQISVGVKDGQTSATIALSYPDAAAASGSSPTLDKGGSTGVATYSVLSYTASDAATSCAVNSATGVATAASAGVCKIGVSVAADSFYFVATTDALVTLTLSSETITWDTSANAVTIRDASGSDRTTTLIGPDSNGLYSLEIKLGDTVKIGFNTPYSGGVGYSSYGKCPSRIGWDQSQMFPTDANGDSFYYLKANNIGACNLDGGVHVAQHLSLPQALFTTPLSPGIMVSVIKGDQAPISVSGNTTPSFGETVTLTAIGGNGTGDRSYSVTGNGCSITTVPLVHGGITYAVFAYGELTNTGAGACQVSVYKAGDRSYQPVTSNPLTVTFGKGTQQISFSSEVPEEPAVGDNYTPTATATSSLGVSFAASGSCSIASGVVSFGSAGDCTITASQSGDADYLSAPNATQVISVGAKNQTISFANIADREFGDPAFGISPTSSEPTAVITLSSADTSVCTVDSNGVIRLVAAGSCTIHADQAGVANELAAASRVSRTFEIYAAGSSAPFITGVSRGLGSLTATVLPPSYTGGATITRYEIQAYDSNGDIAGFNNNCAVAGIGDPQKCTVEGLEQGVSYTLRAKAHHNGGVGSLSPASAAATPVGNPDAVRELTALADNTSLTISWLAPLDLGGATFARYEIYLKLASDASFPVSPSHTVNSSATGDYTFTGLINGESYEVKMVTITDIDTSEIVSNSALVSQVPYTTPNAVRNLAAFELGNSLYITWRYPDFDGGRAITGYDVDVNTGEMACTVTETVCVVSKGSIETFNVDTLASNIAGSGIVASTTYLLSSAVPGGSSSSGSSGGFFVPAAVTPELFEPTLDRQWPIIKNNGMKMIELKGSNLNLITEVMMSGTALEFEIMSEGLVRVYLQSKIAGSMALKLMYSGGALEQAITVQNATNQKINAGTFKGYVALYAKGYEGARLSAKVGKDWVIVESLDGGFVRIMEPVGTGYPINLRIFINKRLVMTLPMTTR